MDQYFDLVEFTRRNIFLTGRAGTGKTTFLRNFTANTKKQYVIVAPTGIAAINAGGVTIHSMFGLPLTTFAPTVDVVDRNEAINIPQLLPHFKYRREKLKLLRALEILIIDEVSMLRCDVLDMIDFALRSARKSQQKFGGVQLLLIGDLYQLPPVVKDSSERILYHYYESPFFFSAKSLLDASLITVTLTKVYRQTDAVFLNLLNAIRNNEVAAADFDLLHSRYHPEFRDDSYINLVSHNYIAQQVNTERLAAIKEKPVTYDATITDDFKEHLYPNDERLVLKKNARVMFMRNDSSEEKAYFNGMLATITHITQESLKVLPDGATESITVEREKWENKKYTIDNNNNIAEKILGKFEQYPLKLAWAVTIHKSQGLTFDKVVIDAGRSFTSGQVYVALSRCRTLEGVVLKSTISANAIFSDERIAAFHQRTEAGEQAAAILEQEKYNYAIDKILWLLDVTSMYTTIDEATQIAMDSKFLTKKQANVLIEQVSVAVQELNDVYRKFDNFITTKYKDFIIDKQGWDLIEERCKSAVKFFYENALEKIFKPVKELYGETRAAKGLKGFNEELKAAFEFSESYLKGLKTAMLLEVPLLTVPAGEEISAKVEKIPTHVVSYKMWNDGATHQQIAAERNLTEGTILSHLAKMATFGIVDMQRLFTIEVLAAFEQKFLEKKYDSLGAWKTAMPQLEFNEIKLLQAHFGYVHKTPVEDV